MPAVVSCAGPVRRALATIATGGLVVAPLLPSYMLSALPARCGERWTTRSMVAVV
ncbi:hypothetical protein [Sphingomonas sp. Leaf10]|uniref:hypothetical protein n=1 Tax=Sphingomonas sp. Leaf10 TaxID=1735676 RepID=UPI0012E157AF|nr:hypothetical protein [Sphingomonas sp. Leaf10]